MSKLSSGTVWWLGGLSAFAAINITLLVLVVGADVLFQAAPQFTAPFAIAAVAVGAALAALFALCKTLMYQGRNTNSGDARDSTAGVFNFRRSPALRSAVVIQRRQATASSTTRNNNTYETII